MDGEKIKWKQVKAEINKVPEAAFYLKKYSTNKTLAYIAMGGAVTFSYLGRQGVNKNTGLFRDANTGLTITSLILVATGTYFVSRSSKNLKQAVSLHNKNRVVIY